jgi:SprT protein
VRRQRRFRYRCDCRDHLLTAVRHNRIVTRNVVYRCRECGGAIRTCPNPA